MKQKKRNGSGATITAIWLALVISVLALGVGLLNLFDVNAYSLINSMTPIEYGSGNVVYMEQKNIDILNSRYVADVDEFVYCLYGKVGDDHYFVKELRETPYSSNESSANFVECRDKKNLLGSIHSHPIPSKIGYISSCKQSDTDKETFNETGFRLAGIICGEDKIAIYDQHDYEKSLPLEVVGG